MVHAWWCMRGGAYVVMHAWCCMRGGAYVVVHAWWCRTEHHLDVMTFLPPPGGPMAARRSWWKKVMPVGEVTMSGKEMEADANVRGKKEMGMETHQKRGGVEGGVV